MPRVSLNFNLPDSSATEALGHALARSLPDAVRSGIGPAGAGAGAGAGAAQAGAAQAGVTGADAAQSGVTGADAAQSGMVRAGTVQSGAVVYLQGELGAGKTTCVRSLLRSLGVTGLVRSPTYTLVETYHVATLTCVHVDLYRLQSLTEVDELGLRDQVGPASLLLVEWPERGRGALPPADLTVDLGYAGDARLAGLSAETTLGIQWLENLGRDRSLSSYVSNLT
ncbi:MAG TPA: tRNA (adenosine(37)-N6)-threonylcarbamoyltransferase complex ATPase subunit type 1 TsaE [Steroidobacteraceae bacterium]